MTTAIVLFAPGFEEIEAVTIVDVLRRGGVEVTMAGVDAPQVRGSHGILVNMDSCLAEVRAADSDALLLPGGMPGARNLAESESVVAALREAATAGKLIGAICAAPIALAAAGLLAGRTVTCYPSFRGQLGACQWIDARVHDDGGLITGQGPAAALDFSLAVVGCLVGPERAADLRTAMLVRP